MSEPMRILVVDDDAFMRESLTSVLCGAYTVACAETGEQSLELAREFRPDMVLLDIELPDVDGYEACRQMLEIDGLCDLHITFLSGHDSLDCRLLAYECGGHDFIAKPFDRDELLRKVDITSQFLADHRRLLEQTSFSTSTAMTAMMSMGELGVVLQFLGKSFSADECGTLAELAVEALEQYGLQGTVQTRCDGVTTNRSTSGLTGSLQESVLGHLKDIDRIFEFKTRAIVNYERVSILINNMPVDDPERRGRIRDNIALLAEGAESRVKALEIEQRARDQQQQLLRALDSLRLTLRGLRSRQELAQTQIWRLGSDLLDQLETSFVTLGLTEAQELFLLELAHRTTAKMDDIAQRGDEVEALLSGLCATLEPLIRENP
ncbi:MAG: response regulator [Methylococcaceae bacterium]|nr:MAG: response regulator [Methylococcaceae bacterium]